MSFDDIRVVAELAETVLLLVKKDETETPGIDCVQIHLGSGSYYKDKIDKFTKFTPFEGVDPNNELVQKYYQQLLYKKLDDKKLFDILLLMNKDE